MKCPMNRGSSILPLLEQTRYYLVFTKVMPGGTESFTLLVEMDLLISRVSVMLDLVI
ncbi:hypothetical protein OAQ34_11735 [Opitutales bacterium]|nr:hypothetical protein [Opitutales bacterium]